MEDGGLTYQRNRNLLLLNHFQGPACGKRSTSCPRILHQGGPSSISPSCLGDRGRRISRTSLNLWLWSLLRLGLWAGGFCRWPKFWKIWIFGIDWSINRGLKGMGGPRHALTPSISWFYLKRHPKFSRNAKFSVLQA